MQSQPWVWALALGNANAKCKGYLAFQASKYITLGNTIAKYCKFFCDSAAILSLELHCSTILKKKTNSLLWWWLEERKNKWWWLGEILFYCIDILFSWVE